MSDIASRERSIAARPPLQVPMCAACVGDRFHTDQEWKNHPLAGHGYSKETGWTHDEAKRLHDLESAYAKQKLQKSPPEAN